MSHRQPPSSLTEFARSSGSQVRYALLAMGKPSARHAAETAVLLEDIAHGATCHGQDRVAVSAHAALAAAKEWQSHPGAGSIASCYWFLRALGRDIADLVPLENASAGRPRRQTQATRVLVFDDSPINVGNLLDAFAGAGHEVAAATNLDNLLEMLPLFRPDVVLVDAQMPRLPLTDLVFLVRDSVRRAKIFLLSAAPTAGRGDVDGVIPKCPPTAVVAAVRNRLLQAGDGDPTGSQGRARRGTRI